MHPPVAPSTLSGIPELLDQIFQATDKQSLGRLAQVSSSFHHISIAHLWSARTLQELLRLLPEGILDDYDIYTRRTHLLRTPQGSDWDRFHHYSVYTKSLDICASQCPRSLMMSLVDRSDVFFPRLLDLIIRAPNNEFPASECIRLARQSLRRLEVKGHHIFGGEEVSYDSDLTVSFFRQLTIQAPDLAEFKIDCFQALNLDPALPANLIETFCHALRSLPHLKKLDWNLGRTGSLPGPILAAIAAHPSISEMLLDRLDIWPRMDNDSRHFPSLKLAKFYCHHRDGGTAFVRTISNPSILSTLDITFYHKEDDLSLRTFQPFSRLFHFALNLTVVRLLWPVSMSWAQLEPLLNCKRLIRLTIWPRTPIAGFNDQAVKDLASSLPLLEVIRFLSPSNAPPPEVTLLGLLPLAQFCPRLLQLTITVTTRAHDPSMIEALRQFRPATLHPLQELNLESSDINTSADTLEFMGARRTAGVLTTLWPLLRSDKAQFGRSSVAPEVRLAWESVHCHMEQREQDGEPIPFI